MASKAGQLHMAFFPQPGHGHMIPTVDMARQFARLGVKATIIFTPANAVFFSKTMQRDRELGLEIGTHIIKFPAAEVGLPEGCEHVTSLTSPEMESKFLKAVERLKEPVSQFLEASHPDCLVADIMFPWATDVAGKFGIPSLIFHGTGCIAYCIRDALLRLQDMKKIPSDSEPFDVPHTR